MLSTACKGIDGEAAGVAEKVEDIASAGKFPNPGAVLSLIQEETCLLALVPVHKELVAALKEDGFWIAVETNGSRDADWLAFVDYVSCSPKAEFPDSLAIARADEVRIVASSEDVVQFCRSVKSRVSATDYYVSPCDRDGNIDFATAKAVLSQLDGWSLSVQLHKLLGFR